MSTPYEAVPEASEAPKFLPSPSIEAGPLGKESLVESTPLAYAVRGTSTATPKEAIATDLAIRDTVTLTHRRFDIVR